MTLVKNAFLKVMGIVTKVELLISEIILAALILVTVVGTLTRYFLSKPFTWIEEFQMACIIWIVFLAGSVAFYMKAHVAIEMVVDLLPKKAQKIVNVIIGILSIFILLYVFKTSMAYIQVFIRSGRLTPILKIPYKWIYGIIPISCILMILEYFHGLLEDRKPDGEEEDEV